MPSGNALIDQMRDRAIADLEVAKLVLPSGDIPQVAWSIEQAYEKIIQSTYCYYKIKGQGQDTDQVYAKLPPKYHTKKYEFILNMLDEFFEALLSNAVGLLSPEYRSALSLEFSEIMGNLSGTLEPEKTKRKATVELERVRDMIQALDSRASSLEAYLESCTRDNLTKSLETIQVEVTVSEGINKLKGPILDAVTNPEAKAAVKSLLNSAEPFINMYNFPAKSLALSRWILPHADVCRYPVPTSAYRNLELYNARSVRLSDFFSATISEVKTLFVNADQFDNAVGWLSNRRITL